MSKYLKNRFQQVLIGSERSGKTFFARHLAQLYSQNHGSVIAYNFGKLEDFPDSEYKLLTPVLFREHRAKIIGNDKNALREYNHDPKIEYFRIGSSPRLYHFRDFNRYFYESGGKVKMLRIMNREEERAFFETVYNYISLCLFILDDCVSIFIYGLKDEHAIIFSRKNHTGAESSIKELRGLGIDVMPIYHDIDSVPTKIWTFTNSIVMFKTFQQPVGTNLKKSNPEAFDIICGAHDYLKEAPQYTALQINLKGDESEILKPFDVTIKL